MVYNIPLYCVFSGNQIQDTYTLHDFSGPSESTSKLALNSPRNSGTRKGYRRLEGLSEENDDIPGQEPVANRRETMPSTAPVEDNGMSSSTESSDEYEKEFFGGFIDTDDGISVFFSV